MKVLVSFSVSIMFCSSVALGQNSKNIDFYKNKPGLNFGTNSTDSTFSYLRKRLDSVNILKDSSVLIPNAFKRSDILFTMPIKELSGENLAPMPGSENLDTMKSKSSNVIELKGRNKK